MKKSILIVVVVLVGVFGYVYNQKTQQVGENNCSISLNGQKFNITLANTNESRAQGLSGTHSLPQNEGKLFVFDTPDTYGFWMKDMNYSIDIIWFDQDWSVVGLQQNVAPQTYPKVFYPQNSALYVLEVNAGLSNSLGLGLGDKVQPNCKAIFK